MDIFEKIADYQEEPVRKIMRNAHDAKAGGIVFFGDSLIQGFDLKKYFNRDTIYNCGCNGATTDLLLHLQPYAIREYGPSKVVMLIGTNDLSDTWQFDKLDIVYNIYKLIEIMRHNNPAVDVCVISPLPIDEKRKKTICRNNMQLKLLGEEIEKIVQEFSGCCYLNVYDDFLKGDNINPDYTEDGLHLSEAGYDLLADKIRFFIEEE